MGEAFDVLDEHGNKTGEVKDRKLVHQDGDWHRAVHVWLYAMDTQRLLIQKRVEFKDSWPGKWDISSAGHVTAGEDSLPTAMRETFEELGVQFPKEAFDFLFTCPMQSTQKAGAFVNNEFDDVYLVTVKEEIPEDAFVLDEAEVDAVRYIAVAELEKMYRALDASLVPADLDGPVLQTRLCVLRAPGATRWLSALREAARAWAPGNGGACLYGKLFEVLKARISSRGLPGSGISTFFHKKRGRQPVQVQCLTFDAAYLKLVPPEAR